MDKKSLGLMCLIGLMLCISTGVVYGTWLAEKEPAAPELSRQIAEEMALGRIALNQDSQVINGGCRDVWIRARIGQAGGETAGPGEAALGYRLVSQTIADNPTEEEKQAGVWVPDRDGYYYYSKPVPPGEQSRPLFQSVAGSGTGPDPAGQPSGRNARIRVHAEAVQTNWLASPAKNSREAFRQFTLQALEAKGTVV